MSDPLQSLMAGMSSVTIVQTASSGNLLDGGVEHTFQHSVLEALMEVADLPELFSNPALVHARWIIGQLSLTEVVVEQRLVSRLCREHAALNGEVNPFESLRVEEAGGV